MCLKYHVLTKHNESLIVNVNHICNDRLNVYFNTFYKTPVCSACVPSAYN